VRPTHSWSPRRWAFRRTGDRRRLELWRGAVHGQHGVAAVATPAQATLRHEARFQDWRAAKGRAAWRAANATSGVQERLARFCYAFHTLLPVRSGRCAAPLLLERVGAPIRLPDDAPTCAWAPLAACRGGNGIVPPCSCPVGFGPDKCRAGDGPWKSPSRRAARPPRRRQGPLPRTGRTVNGTGHGAPSAAAWCQATQHAHGVVPGESWGTLPTDLRKAWVRKRCDARVPRPRSSLTHAP